jgi:hypothetical protein
MSSKPRKTFDGVGRPKSPLDDFGKAVAKQVGKRLKKSEIQNMKRYARSEGFAKSYEKTGLDKAVEKKLGKATGMNTWKESTSSSAKNKLKKTKENALALHKDRMYLDKQDKVARLYGDTDGPHERFFREMYLPRNLNKMGNKAFREEVEIGRKQAQAGNKAAARMLRPKTQRAKTKTTKGKR